MLSSHNLLILQGCTEVLNQACEMLKKLNDCQYRARPSEGQRSSIGEHYRHVLDLFNAVKQGLDSGVVDYDKRKRGTSVETQRSQGLALCEGASDFFSSLNNSQLQRSVEVKTEVTLLESHSVQIPTTIARELVFTTTHAVHHFATIREIAASLDCDMPSDIGFAPATRSFLRGQNA